MTQLRYFTRVAELGSMSAAADDMYIAQSAISTAISQLESTVGEQLFHRLRSKGVSLTDEGLRFYQMVTQGLRQIDEAVENISSEELSGLLTAGCFTTLGQFWIPPVIEQLNSVHQGLTVEMRQYNAVQLESALLTREIEAAIAYNFDYGPNIKFEEIGTVDLFAGLSEEHPLAKRTSIKLEELISDPLILLNLGKSADYFLSVFDRANLIPQIAYKFESFEAVRSMAARGYGYALLNQGPTHGLTNEGLPLNMIPIEGYSSDLQIGIISRNDEPLSRKGKAFRDSFHHVFMQVNSHHL
ncbi:LysR family transcriptional regulator [Corynebacterium sp. sy039]|uniref:LysR family transcriptional regulator n=1 Tax=Corynebacterium sp. sy039 TaxID=2599641 RepID=UPI0011B443A4|nr:LysR family transcriptional regulator [Corynebacterium sp. sy039]QDZ42488.1 LysR family transcriptional regulator [Corynebacterium sp. sy039]